MFQMPGGRRRRYVAGDTLFHSIARFIAYRAIAYHAQTNTRQNKKKQCAAQTVQASMYNIIYTICSCIFCMLINMYTRFTCKYRESSARERSGVVVGIVERGVGVMLAVVCVAAHLLYLFRQSRTLAGRARRRRRQRRQRAGMFRLAVLCAAVSAHSPKPTHRLFGVVVVVALLCIFALFIHLYLPIAWCWCLSAFICRVYQKVLVVKC